MEIYSSRKWFTDNSTISELCFDEEIEPACFILEPTTRAGKDPRGIVAISTGRYELTSYKSPRFKMIVPLLNNVPGHVAVEMHPGNFSVDTKDCLLPGLYRGLDCVENSRDAFESIFPRIQAAWTTEQVFITIKNSGE